MLHYRQSRTQCVPSADPHCSRKGSNMMGTFSAYLSRCLWVFFKDPVWVSLLCQCRWVMSLMAPWHCTLPKIVNLYVRFAPRTARKAQAAPQDRDVPCGGWWVTLQGTVAPAAWRLSAHPPDSQQPIYVTEEIIQTKASKKLPLVVICLLKLCSNFLRCMAF